MTTFSLHVLTHILTIKQSIIVNKVNNVLFLTIIIDIIMNEIEIVAYFHS
jgi:hypothetical protein